MVQLRVEKSGSWKDRIFIMKSLNQDEYAQTDIEGDFT
jgi:hypothetical protein